MSVLNMFKVEFRFVKAAAAGIAGSAYQYVFPVRKVIVAASSGHPKDILAVLNADLTAPSGTTLEIISVSPHESVGTEGAIIA
jgi:hypothetical protein